MSESASMLVFRSAILVTCFSGCVAPPPTIGPPQSDVAGASVAWAGAVDNVNLDLDWKLPNGSWLQSVERAGWGANGAESMILPLSTVPDGVHELWLSFNGNGVAALTTLNVDFFKLRFNLNQTLLGSFGRKIVVETRDGASWTLFNGWLPATDPNAGGPTGLYPLEVQSAWRDASEEVNVDLGVTLPSGAQLDVRNDGWSVQGFERAVLSPGAAVPDGTYQLNFQLNGGGQTANVTQFAAFPGWSRRWDEVLLGPECRIIGLDVTNGQTTLLYDGWRPATDSGAGGVSAQHAADFVVGWRDATSDVTLDLELIAPNGARIPVWTNGWLHQGFERAAIRERVAVTDGNWRLRMNLYGSGNTAHVSLDGRLLGWRFATTKVLLANAQHEILLNVRGDTVIELANSLR